MSPENPEIMDERDLDPDRDEGDDAVEEAIRGLERMFQHLANHKRGAEVVEAFGDAQLSAAARKQHQELEDLVMSATIFALEQRGVGLEALSAVLGARRDAAPGIH